MVQIFTLNAVTFLPRTSAIGALVALACTQAYAVNGAQMNGFGIKNAGMGGVGIAVPLDASAPAYNPAGLSFVPDSFALNLVGFQGDTTAGIGPVNFKDNTSVLAPEGGFVKSLTRDVAMGLTLVGSGAGSDYGAKFPTGPLPVVGTPENLKSSRKIAEIITSIAWKPSDNLALGLGVIYVRQEMSSQGLIQAAMVPGVGPAAVVIPGHGNQSATGWSSRLGALWQATPEWTLGATYRAKTGMSSFKGYSADILAYSNGVIDLPSEYGFGASWKATPALTLGADWVKVNYSDVKANRDPIGPNWSDQRVLKLGASWSISPIWTLRSGYSKNDAQIDSTRVLQNLLSPAIDRAHLAFGATMKLDDKSDISISLDRSLRTTLTGNAASTGYALQGNSQVIRLGYQKLF